MLFTPLNRRFRLSRVSQTIDLEEIYRLVSKSARPLWPEASRMLSLPLPLLPSEEGFTPPFIPPRGVPNRRVGTTHSPPPRRRTSNKHTKTDGKSTFSVPGPARFAHVRYILQKLHPRHDFLRCFTFSIDVR